MRKIAKEQEQGGAEIDLTPMLDVVFIMLIFFIVVASFIKEAGVEVNRPDDNQPDDPEDSTSILVEVASDNQIWMENRRVDIRAVRANIQRLLAEDPEAPVTIKVEKGAEAGVVVDVADAARALWWLPCLSSSLSPCALPWRALGAGCWTSAWASEWLQLARRSRGTTAAVRRAKITLAAPWTPCGTTDEPGPCDYDEPYEADGPAGQAHGPYVCLERAGVRARPVYVRLATHCDGVT